MLMRPIYPHSPIGSVEALSKVLGLTKDRAYYILPINRMNISILRNELKKKINLFEQLMMLSLSLNVFTKKYVAHC